MIRTFLIITLLGGTLCMAMRMPMIRGALLVSMVVRVRIVVDIFGLYLLVY